MAATSRKEMIVGIAFFGILVTLGVFTILIGEINPFKEPTFVYVHFPKGVGGLRIGNVVRIAGLEVGKVDRMALADVGVVAQLKLSPDINLHNGYGIKVRSFSALGGKYVDVLRGNTKAPILDLKVELSDKLPTEADLQRYSGPQGPILTGNVEVELISELADLAEEIKPEITKAIRNIREATDRINSMQGTLGKVIGDPQLYDNLASASGNIDRASADLADVLEKINHGNGSLAKLVNDSKLYDHTTKLAEHLSSVAAKVDTGQGTVGRLFNDDKMADDLATSVEHIEALLAKVRAGEGTVGALLNERKLYDELADTFENMKLMTAKAAEGRGPLGVMLTDEEAAEQLRRTIARIDKVSEQVAAGRGTVGKLLMDDKLITETERVIVEVRESIEDLREQAPINSFVQAVFQAF